MTEISPTFLAKAVAHPLRVEILELLGTSGTYSPNMLAGELDAPLTNVSYHVRMLLELGAIELTRTEPRRGALEHYYRPTAAGVIARNTARTLRRAIARHVAAAAEEPSS